jgi:hypothetical protein
MRRGVASGFGLLPSNPQCHNPVGASLLAMVDNDNAGFLNERGALKSIASRLAPTGVAALVEIPAPHSDAIEQ